MSIAFYLTPHWPAPGNVRAFVSTRQSGGSSGDYASFNLATHVGDDPNTVQANRKQLQNTLSLPSEPFWLSQVHSTIVLSWTHLATAPVADGSWTAQSGKVCVVMTADCLPVLLCDQQGACVAALHAGWRGLAAGILEAGVRALPVAPAQLLAWMGPGISGKVYEVGEEVRQVFLSADARAERAFHPAAKPNCWYADLYLLARNRLQAAGVPAIYGGEYCSYSEPERFFSYRRDGQTGRMASLIWLE